jgi:DNA-binding response OmpR family regulator
MVSPSTESISGLSLMAPSPDAVAELTRPDGCVLVLGEHLGRLRDLAEGLLRVGCRVEIAALTPVNQDAPLGIADHRLTIVDAIQLTRPSVEIVNRARAEAATQPIVAVAVTGGNRHRLAAAHYVVGRVNESGDLADTPRVVRDILSTWSAVRPLVGPGDLRVDRIGRRASVRGRQLALRPADFRLLRALAEKVRRGCTVDELRAAAISSSRAEDRRATAEVRHGVERLRSLFRRTDVRLVSTPDGRYRLTMRPDRPLVADRRAR